MVGLKGFKRLLGFLLGLIVIPAISQVPKIGTDTTLDVGTWNIEWFGGSLGPTDNNLQQNNIQLNNYGQEDLTMLTDKYMRKMVIYPYTAIPKMIKKIHFNDKYPANQNIRLLNKK